MLSSGVSNGNTEPPCCSHCVLQSTYSSTSSEPVQVESSVLDSRSNSIRLSPNDLTPLEFETAPVFLDRAIASGLTADESFALVELRFPGAILNKRQIRQARWKEGILKLTAERGRCYLLPVKFSRRPFYATTLALNPYFARFVSVLRPGDLDLDAAKILGFYRVPDSPSRLQYHIAVDGPSSDRLCSVAGAIACMLTTYPFLNTEYLDLDGYSEITTLPLCGFLGDQVYTEPDLSGADLWSLLGVDFSQCRCKIHSPPVTSDVKFAATGCCKKPAGAAKPLENAFYRVHHACTVDESVRQQDKKFLQYVLSGKDPGILSDAVRPKDFSRLCTSSMATDIRAFSNGYCYLNLLERDTWWRVARLLGPCPDFASFYLVLLWAGKSTMKVYRFEEVKSGWFHAVPDRALKGVTVDAGAIHKSRVATLLARCSGARFA